MEEHEVDLKEAAQLSLSLLEHFETTNADPYEAYVAMQLVMLQLEESLQIKIKEEQ